jgi:pimeloyl-ACP methyl ester carboxylesterase
MPCSIKTAESAEIRRDVGVDVLNRRCFFYVREKGATRRWSAVKLTRFAIGVIVCIAFLVADRVQSATIAAEVASRFIRKTANADAVIIFVHGFASDGISAWTSSTGSYWPELLSKDPTFDGADIFVYSYPTGPTATLSIDELAEDMRRTLTAKGVTTHKKIIFLSHSMGGLITRAYLLKNREVADRISFVYFFSTPTSGSQIASIAHLIFSGTQIAKMINMNPEDYLADLQRQWLAAGFKFPSHCAYEKKPTMGVALAVSMASAVQLCSKAADPIDADHFSIVKPESEDAPQYLAFQAAYAESKMSTANPGAPDVAMRFVHPMSPMLVLENASGSIAREIKKTIAIWNADDLRTYIAGSSGIDPLPIPISTFDVLRPHVSSGPEAIFQPSVNQGFVKAGNRLIGSIGVVCPTCSRGHSYFVCLTWGEGGWYAELSEQREGEVVVPKRITKANLDLYFRNIEQWPAPQRHVVKEID